MQDPIYVTRTFLPPRAEYDAWLDKIYESHILTNNGPVHNELEEKLRSVLNADHLLLTSNGTIALQLAIRTLGVTGKVITTPFSYVATVSAILWEGCTPVFADIDPRTCCIDPAKIEALIDDETTAILATHVYGFPCDVDAIKDIADRHGLKVIYDGAHAFGTIYKAKSLTSYGDACTLSFHATKLFHTVEGGAVILHSEEVRKKMRLQRSFGHIGDEHFELGINGKMSEMHAAMGMAVLPYVPELIKTRRSLTERYAERLKEVNVTMLSIPVETEFNYGYLPLILPTGKRQIVTDALAAVQIHPRRYFFPSLNTLPYLEYAQCPVSEDMASRMLCMPLYRELSLEDVDRICSVIAAALK